MAIVVKKEVVCKACDEKSCQYFLSDRYTVDLFNYYGSLNKNDYFKYLLQECPNCGYIETDISKPLEYDILDFKMAYKPFDELCDSVLAARFAKYACYLSKISDYKGACDNYLYSAFVYDDLKKKDRAHMMLRFALDFANELAFSPLISDRQKYIVLRADILRRVGEFEKVLDIDPKNCSLEKEDIARLIYEKELARNKDQSIYAINSFK